MPTCTLPFEILLEFCNDTAEPSTLQLIREGENVFTSHASAVVYPEESISLVLNAGSAYHYLLKQDRRKAQLTVKVWKDTKICATDVFVKKRPPPSQYPPIGSQEISIVCHPS